MRATIWPLAMVWWMGAWLGCSSGASSPSPAPPPREEVGATSEAYGFSTTISLVTPGGACSACGGDWVDPSHPPYTGDSYQFDDSMPVGANVWAGTVSLDFAPCSYFRVEVLLNGFSLGILTRGSPPALGTTATCSCGACDSAGLSMHPLPGFPDFFGYYPGRRNTLTLRLLEGRVAPQRVAISVAGEDELPRVILRASKTSVFCGELVTLIADVTKDGAPFSFGHFELRRSEQGPPTRFPPDFGVTPNGHAEFVMNDPSGWPPWVLPVGTTSWVAWFIPATTRIFQAASNTVAITVNGIPGTLSLSTSGSPVVLGAPLTITAVARPVFESPTRPLDGSVTFRDSTDLHAPVSLGAAPLVNGRATLTTSALPLGARQLSAFLVPPGNGDKCESLSPTPLTQLVVPAEPPPPHVTVACADTPCTPASPIDVAYVNASPDPGAWVSIAPLGSAPTSFVAWRSTGGAVGGTSRFGGVAPGEYVARAYADAGNTPIAESAAFVVAPDSAAPTLVATCSASPCTASDAITVAFTHMPGYVDDWIALVPQGAPSSAYAQYRTTGGAPSGAVTFDGPPAGRTLVARAFAHGTMNAVGADSAPIVVAAGAPPTLALACDASPCASGGAITATFDGMPRAAHAWIALAEVGSPATSTDAWGYTGGAPSGARTFTAGAPATYVARAYADDGFAVIGESAPLVVTPLGGAALTATCAPGCHDVLVTFANMPGYVDDWIAVYTVGAAAEQYVQYKYTGGRHAGSIDFTALPGGAIIVARAFAHGSYAQVADSNAVALAAASTPPAIAIEARSAARREPASLRVAWSAMPNDARAWIGLVRADAPSGLAGWTWTRGAATGALDLSGVGAGTYVARAYGYGETVLAESAPITIASDATVGPGG